MRDLAGRAAGGRGGAQDRHHALLRPRRLHGHERGRRPRGVDALLRRVLRSRHAASSRRTAASWRSSSATPSSASSGCPPCARTTPSAPSAPALASCCAPSRASPAPTAPRCRPAVGVNTGVARGAPRRRPLGSGEGFLTGDAVNTAARLQGAAPPMGVVVGELTHKPHGGGLRLRGARAARAEGQVRTGEGVARARGGRRASGTRRRDQGDADGRPRAPSSRRACRAVDRLRAGEGGLLLITGEAGIGKTRLVEELRALRRSSRAAPGSRAARSPSAASISYWPFLEIVQQDAGIDSDDAEAERWAKLAARVTASSATRPGGPALPGDPAQPAAARGAGCAGRAPGRRGDGPPALPRLASLLRAPRRGAAAGRGLRGRALAGRLLGRPARAPPAAHRRAADPLLLRLAARARHGRSPASQELARTDYAEARREIALQPLSTRGERDAGAAT